MKAIRTSFHRWLPSAVALAVWGAVAHAQTPATQAPKLKLEQIQPTPVEQLPDDHLGRLIRYGKELTERTFAYIGPEVKDPAMRYAGNNLACASCHQAAATKEYAMPWLGVAATFPQYRAREDDISTLQDRINGCMERSMNGKPLPWDSREMRAFVAYITHLSKGVPIGAEIEGLGTVTTRMPNRRANPEAGAKVYAAKCASCHGEDGQGRRVGQPGDAQGYLFPPLWGPDSFNTGAGMNRLAMATRFVYANMPLGASHGNVQLTLDEAYDVAAYMLSQPRPEKAGLEKDFPARWNKPVDAAFPPYLLANPDQHKYGPFPPLVQKQQQMKAQLMEYARREQAASGAAAAGR
ncbi:Thiosulfate dehydrogenase [Tepidimonas alkaliphilus]|uniref:Thiosulfate dehydrogenase n=1 Tax=Tepidimonas alkaliphilus TaxID=2588942 RepID=A0A554WBM8_9BURK|nr:c-type cytochrome [Tepidimonas alkaliphilus]TSE20977.1 Thiosulfate dehydrogenase [Tepidimonas alkaliphilus]